MPDSLTDRTTSPLCVSETGLMPSDHVCGCPPMPHCHLPSYHHAATCTCVPLGLGGYRGFRGSGGEGGRIVKVVFQTSHLRHKKQSFFALLELSFVLRHARRSPSFRPKQDFRPKQSCRNFGSLNTRNHRSVSKKVCKSGFTRVAVAVAEIRSFENCFPLFHERS